MIVKRLKQGFWKIYCYISIHKILTYLTDLCCFAIALVVFLGIDIRYDRRFENAPLNMLFIILPTVLSIVSIVIQLRKDKFFGLTSSELNSIRFGFYFNYLHMVLVLFGLCTFYLVVESFGVGYCSIIVLDVVSLLYSIIFSIQEIPILLQSNNCLKRIVKTTYMVYEKGDFFKRNKKLYNVFRKWLCYLVIEYGVDNIYGFLRKKTHSEACRRINDKLFTYLLSILCEFLRKFIDYIPSQKEDFESWLTESKIDWIVDGCYDLIHALVFSSNREKERHKLTRDQYFRLVSILYYLHHICSEKLALADVEKKRFGGMFVETLYPHFSNDDYLIFLLQASISNIENSKLWFLTLLRDNLSSPHSIFYLSGPAIGTFLSFVLFFVFESRYYSDAFKEDVRKFINEPCKGLNAFDNTNWKESFCYVLKYEDNVAESLLYKLCYMFDKLGEEYFSALEINGNHQMITIDLRFNKAYLIRLWLLLVLYTPVGLSISSMSEIYSRLDPDSKECFIEAYSDYEKEQSIDFGFFKFFGIEYKNEANIGLKKQTFDVYNKKVSSEIKESVKRAHDYTNFEDIKNELCDGIQAAAMKCDVFCGWNDELTKQETEGVLTYWIVLDSPDILIRTVSSYFGNDLCSFIRCQSTNAINNEEVIKGNKFSAEQVEKIKDFAPETTSFYWYQLESLYPEYEVLKLNQKESRSTYPPNCFFKRGFIYFSFKINKEKSSTRFVSDSEANDFIDKNYTPNEVRPKCWTCF